MTKDFVEQLLSDIRERRDAVHAGTCFRLVAVSGDLPAEASIGTLFMRSAAGSLIEFYTWIDPSYCHGPMYSREEVTLTTATFHRLERTDRAYFQRWDDFTLYDLDQYHNLLGRLERSGFCMMRNCSTFEQDEIKDVERYSNMDPLYPGRSDKYGQTEETRKREPARSDVTIDGVPLYTTPGTIMPYI